MTNIAPETGGGAGEALPSEGSATALDGRVIDARGDPSVTPWEAPNPSEGGVVGRPGWAPEGLPDHMTGATPEESLAEVTKAYRGLLRLNSERGTIPEDLTAYTFEPSETLAPFMEDFAADPLWQNVLENAQRAGITTDQFASFIGPVLESWMGDEALGLVKPVDFDAEVMKLVPPEASELDERGQRAAASRRINDALAFMDGVKAQGLDGDTADYLVAQLGDDARGIQAIEFFMSQSRRLLPALGGQGGGGATDSDLTARLLDPRGNPDSPSFDRGFAAQTDRLYQEHYGTKRGGHGHEV